MPVLFLAALGGKARFRFSSASARCCLPIGQQSYALPPVACEIHAEACAQGCA